MFTQYVRTNEWVIPNTDSEEHPACLSTREADSVGAKLLCRLESVGIADPANNTEVLKDPKSELYWLIQQKSDDKSTWHVLTSLDDKTSCNLVECPEVLLKYGETGDWHHPYSVKIEWAIHLNGRLDKDTSDDKLATLLRSNGLTIRHDQSRFVEIENFHSFRIYFDDRSFNEVSVDAYAHDIVELVEHARFVSDVLTKADIEHKFEIDTKSTKTAPSYPLPMYFQHDWQEQNGLA